MAEGAHGAPYCRKGIHAPARRTEQATPRTAVGRRGEELRVRRSERPGNTHGSLRRPQPTDHLPFHVRTRLEEGCKSCSFLADHFDATRIHLAHRDTSFAAVSRAPMPRIQAFQKRMGWRFHWVSAFGNDFNRDYGVQFTKEELAGEVNYNYHKTRFGLEEAPGLSVFYKDEAGEVFHTYSTYARGLDSLVGTYHFLDLVPKGRDEDGLAFTMAWVRHHDKYGDDYVVDPTATYEKPREMGACCEHSERA